MSSSSTSAPPSGDTGNETATKASPPSEHGAEPKAAPATAPHLTGSAKLFHDALLEDGDTTPASSSKPHLHPHRASNLQRLHTEHIQFQYPNWTGDERTEDAVLRMLVDKYKPLRGGGRSAEEKMRRDPPKTRPVDHRSLDDGRMGDDASDPADSLKDILSQRISATPLSPFPTSTTNDWTPPKTPSKTGSWATEPLLPSSPDHKPWETTFRAPAHASLDFVPAVKPAVFESSPTSHGRKLNLNDPNEDMDARARKAKREEKRKSLTAGRLGRAKEAMLDYKLGIKSSKGGVGAGRSSGEGEERRANPQSLKGWTSLVEDRIEKARKAGQFASLSGRGRPLPPDILEQNPFISREEFFLNRIVQRNGAVPPWVQLQNELEDALDAFRRVMRESWVKSATRGISSRLPSPSSLSSNEVGSSVPSLESIQAYRDQEWEKREAAYHNAAIKEINSLVRKYNGMAPYAVRRAVYTVEGERERMYGEVARDVWENLKQRGKEGLLGASTWERGYKESEAVRGGGLAGEAGWSIGELLRELVDRIFGRISKKG